MYIEYIFHGSAGPLIDIAAMLASEAARWCTIVLFAHLPTIECYMPCYCNWTTLLSLAGVGSKPAISHRCYCPKRKHLHDGALFSHATCIYEEPLFHTIDLIICWIRWTILPIIAWMCVYNHARPIHTHTFCVCSFFPFLWKCLLWHTAKRRHCHVTELLHTNMLLVTCV